MFHDICPKFPWFSVGKRGKAASGDGDSEGVTILREGTANPSEITSRAKQLGMVAFGRARLTASLMISPICSSNSREM